VSYERQEGPELQAFYRLMVPAAASIPEDLGRLVAQLAERTGLPRRAAEYPVDEPTIAAAAEELVEGVRAVFGFTLDLAVDDATQLDRFLDAHVIDPALRPFFADGGPRKELGEDESRRFAECKAACRAPDEPLLVYALGAFWGEWLVRHRRFQWRLYPPLRPVQAFPDMITAQATICVHPFSQVCKKLGDPEADNLAFKARVFHFTRRYFPPYALLASLADSEQAAIEMLPPSAREALVVQQQGDAKRALELLLRAGEEDTHNPRLLYLIITAAYRLKLFDLMEGTSYHLLEMIPDHPLANHNLAVLYASRKELLPEAEKLLRTALASDPEYSRAHITLAMVLRDLDRIEEAKEHVRWVREHDPEMRAEADDWLRRLASPSN
jgi:tetratricopeptide (TPR) repeat protein